LSARLRTAESFAFKYGRIEVVARLPRGDWMWPAIWLMPTNAAYGTWPASGEIDIVESRGNARGYPGGGCESISSTLHYGPYWPQDAYLNTHASFSAATGDLTTDFHTYGLLWTQDRLTTYIDDTVVLDVAVNESFWQRGGWETSAPGSANPWADSPNNVAPFDQRMYVILNVAVGGTNGYFPDGVAGKPWQDTSDSSANEFWAAKAAWYPSWTSPFMVDSVTVWQDPAQGGDYVIRPML
jgi:beta-glucanase (GH16 family)